jgi:hypothetical protein
VGLGCEGQQLSGPFAIVVLGPSRGGGATEAVVVRARG